MKLLEERVDFSNESSSLENAVCLHGVLTLQGVAQVLHLSNPGQRISIQKDWLHFTLLALGKDDALCF